MQEAIKSYFRAFFLVEMQSLFLSADALKISFLAQQQPIYAELADLLIQIGRTDEAFKVVEHGRSRGALHLLSSRQSGIKSAAGSIHTGPLKEIGRQIAKLRTSIISGNLDEVSQRRLEDDLVQLNVRREEMRIQVESERLRTFTSPITLEQLQAAVLAPDEVLIEFFLAQDRSFVWLVTREHADCIDLPPQDEIGKRVREYLDLLATRPSNRHLERRITSEQTYANTLFDILLGKFMDRIKPGKRLVFVPDGVLHYLPFESLMHRGRYLIQDYVISYVPSASVLGLVTGRKREPGLSGVKELLAFGDPFFSLPDSRKRNNEGVLGQILAHMVPARFLRDQGRDGALEPPHQFLLGALVTVCYALNELGISSVIRSVHQESRETTASARSPYHQRSGHSGLF